MNTDKMTFLLNPSDAMEKAKQLVRMGTGEVNSMEVIGCILELTKDHPERVEFVRIERDETVKYSHREAEIAFNGDMNILPL